jgi:hypothetical protein
VRDKDPDALDFDPLCAETFNDEQSIKRNEAQSNTNHGSALTADKGKEKGPQANKGQQDSGRMERILSNGSVQPTELITTYGLSAEGTPKVRTSRATTRSRRKAQ